MSILGLQTLLALLASLCSTNAGALSPEEQDAFAAGLRLIDAGDARGAERAWRAGYAARHDPAFLVRIGEAQEKAGAAREAAQTYEQYLRESPAAADREEIEARVRRLTPAAAPSPAREIEEPGSMQGPGPGQSGAPVRPGAPAVPAAAAVQFRDDGAPGPEPRFAADGSRSAVNVAAWIGTGVTTLLLGVAAFSGALAAEKAGDANRLLIFRDPDTGMPQEYASVSGPFEDDVRSGRRDDKVAKGLVIAAGVTAVISTILFVVDGRTSSPRSGGEQSRRDFFPSWTF